MSKIPSIGYKWLLSFCSALNSSPDRPHPPAKFVLIIMKSSHFRYNHENLDILLEKIVHKEK